MDMKQLKAFLAKEKGVSPTVIRFVEEVPLHCRLMLNDGWRLDGAQSVHELFRDALHNLTFYTDEGPSFDAMMSYEEDMRVRSYLLSEVLSGGPDDKCAAKALAQWPEDSEELRELFKRSFKKEQEMNDD